MDNIHVAVRVRPLIKREVDDDERGHWCVDNSSIYQSNSPSVSYTFDRVFNQDESSNIVYSEICAPLVDSVMKGFNGTIFAYGQTSSGKTYTMMGDKKHPGIIKQTIKQIFCMIENMPEREFLLRVSYVEIYKECLSDLLAKKNEILKIQEDRYGYVNISGLQEEMVQQPDQIFKLLDEGENKRHFGETQMNEKSSRSHTIFRMIIESREINAGNDAAVCVSQFNLVDLAGSERVQDVKTTGERFKEGININKSLLTLGLVIRQLSEGKEGYHIKYRDSKLTRILQNSLGGNARTVIICTVTPASLEDTHSTLKFASQAKRIKNMPKINEIMTEQAKIRQYANRIKTLTEELEASKAQGKELEEKRKQNENLKRQIQELFVVSRLAPGCISRKARRETWGGKMSHSRLSSIPARNILPAKFLPTLQEEIPEFDEDFDTLEPDTFITHRSSKSVENKSITPEFFHAKAYNHVEVQTENIIQDPLPSVPELDIKEQIDEMSQCNSKLKNELAELSTFTRLERQIMIAEHDLKTEVKALKSENRALKNSMHVLRDRISSLPTKEKEIIKLLLDAIVLNEHDVQESPIEKDISSLSEHLSTSTVKLMFEQQCDHEVEKLNLKIKILEEQLSSKNDELLQLQALHKSDTLHASTHDSIKSNCSISSILTEEDMEKLANKDNFDLLFDPGHFENVLNVKLNRLATGFSEACIALNEINFQSKDDKGERSFADSKIKYITREEETIKETSEELIKMHSQLLENYKSISSKLNTAKEETLTLKAQLQEKDKIIQEENNELKILTEVVQEFSLVMPTLHHKLEKIKSYISMMPNDNEAHFQSNALLENTASMTIDQENELSCTIENSFLECSYKENAARYSNIANSVNVDFNVHTIQDFTLPFEDSVFQLHPQRSKERQKPNSSFSNDLMQLEGHSIASEQNIQSHPVAKLPDHSTPYGKMITSFTPANSNRYSHVSNAVASNKTYEFENVEDSVKLTIADGNNLEQSAIEFAKEIDSKNKSICLLNDNLTNKNKQIELLKQKVELKDMMISSLQLDISLRPRYAANESIDMTLANSTMNNDLTTSIHVDPKSSDSLPQLTSIIQTVARRYEKFNSKEVNTSVQTDIPDSQTCPKCLELKHVNSDLQEQSIITENNLQDEMMQVSTSLANVITYNISIQTEEDILKMIEDYKFHLDQTSKRNICLSDELESKKLELVTLTKELEAKTHALLSLSKKIKLGEQDKVNKIHKCVNCDLIDNTSLEFVQKFEAQEEVILQYKKQIKDLESRIDVMIEEDNLRHQEFEEIVVTYQSKLQELHSLPRMCDNCSYNCKDKESVTNASQDIYTIKVNSVHLYENSTQTDQVIISTAALSDKLLVPYKDNSSFNTSFHKKHEDVSHPNELYNKFVALKGIINEIEHFLAVILDTYSNTNIFKAQELEEPEIKEIILDVYENAKINSLKAMLNQLVALVNDRFQVCGNLKTELSLKSEEICDLNRQLVEAQSNLASKANEMSSFTDEIACYQSHLSKKETILTDITEKLKVSEAELSKFRNYVDEMEKVLNNKQDAALQTSIGLSPSERKTAAKYVQTDPSSKLLELEQEMNKISTEMEEMKVKNDSVVSAYDEKIAHLEAQLTISHKVPAAFLEEIKELKEDHDFKIKKMQLNHKKDEEFWKSKNDDRINNLQEYHKMEIENKARQFSIELEGKLAESRMSHEKKIGEMKEPYDKKLIVINCELQQLEMQLTEKESEMNQLRASKCNEIAELKKKHDIIINMCKSHLKDAQSKIKSLKQELNRKTEECSKLKEQCESTPKDAKEIEEMEEKLNRYRRELFQDKEQARNLKHEKKRMQEKCDSLETKLSEIQAQLDKNMESWHKEKEIFSTKLKHSEAETAFIKEVLKQKTAEWQEEKEAMMQRLKIAEKEIVSINAKYQLNLDQKIARILSLEENNTKLLKERVHVKNETAQKPEMAAKQEFRLTEKQKSSNNAHYLKRRSSQETVPAGDSNHPIEKVKLQTDEKSGADKMFENPHYATDSGCGATHMVHNYQLTAAIHQKDKENKELKKELNKYRNAFKHAKRDTRLNPYAREMQKPKENTEPCTPPKLEHKEVKPPLLKPKQILKVKTDNIVLGEGNHPENSKKLNEAVFLSENSTIPPKTEKCEATSVNTETPKPCRLELWSNPPELTKAEAQQCIQQ